LFIEKGLRPFLIICVRFFHGFKDPIDTVPQIVKHTFLVAVHGFDHNQIGFVLPIDLGGFNIEADNFFRFGSSLLLAQLSG